MFDEDNLPRPKKKGPEPRVFAGLDVEDLKEYLEFLESEKRRTHDEIKHRQDVFSGASAVFKKPGN